ncbi:MAG: 30S ribosomal protein S8 [Methylacidiphilales bacterium]|nr:30S ribosomal protein S8 [Candidatus Methylacidiphilales bacterium]MDW8348974.1 30S ribosomal protein S8 [Verrucomicrobiae bacterium]
MQTDPISDFITCLRNAVRAHLVEVTVPHSRVKGQIARVLKEEGYLSDVEIIPNGKKPLLKVRLRVEGKRYALTDIQRESKPGLRRYVSCKEIPRVLGGMGIAVLSTPKGIITGHKAKKLGLGGELLLTVH